jgi:hypothetical protein
LVVKKRCGCPFAVADFITPLDKDSQTRYLCKDVATATAGKLAKEREAGYNQLFSLSKVTSANVDASYVF